MKKILAIALLAAVSAAHAAQPSDPCPALGAGAAGFADARDQGVKEADAIARINRKLREKHASRQAQEIAQGTVEFVYRHKELTPDGIEQAITDLCHQATQDVEDNKKGGAL